jgi:hypothetical protein
MTYLFTKFDSIPRLRRDMIVTEKLDGTNSQVCIIDPDAEGFMGLPDTDPVAVYKHCYMYAGSRKRWITPHADNYGFARWAADNSEDLFALGTGHHFGEWWGQGIQRKYGMDHKVWSLFNRKRWHNAIRGAWVAPDTAETVSVPAPHCCDVVPILGWGEFDLQIVDACLHGLSMNGSVAAYGFMKPEGIVVWHRAANQLFKQTLLNDGVPKGKPA